MLDEGVGVKRGRGVAERLVALDLEEVEVRDARARHDLLQLRDDYLGCSGADFTSTGPVRSDNDDKIPPSIASQRLGGRCNGSMATIST